MRLEIKKIGQNGDGIAYENNKPIFVSNALVGEIVDVSFTKNNQFNKQAKVNKYIKTSKSRSTLFCKCYKHCGGCNILHANYDEQLKIKVNLLKQSLIKYSDINTEIEIDKSPLNIEYRNSLKLPFAYGDGKLVTSLYENDTNHFVIFDQCFNHEQILEETRKNILEIANEFHLKPYDRHTKKGLRYLYMRHLSNAIQICIVTGDDVLNNDFIFKVSKLDKVVSLYQNINTSKTTHSIFGKKMIHLAGSSKLRFRINNIKANLSIKSFFQMNSMQTNNMYEYVCSLLNDNQKLIVEAYCGIGIMSLLVANKSNKVIGIEVIEDAILNAKNNAQLNNINNVEFICGDAGEELKYIGKKQRIDTLIADPPRGGLDDLMLQSILKSNINTIIYVSCNDVTLSQNISILSNKYKLESIKAFDMFPNTTHVESVSKLVRK